MKACRPGGWRGGFNDASEVGADFLCGVGDRRRPRLYRHIGGLGGYRPISVLCLRGDLPGPAGSGPDDLPGVAPRVTVVPGRCEASNPEVRDSPMHNCASEVWCLRTIPE